jgi:hypothetical protein
MKKYTLVLAVLFTCSINFAQSFSVGPQLGLLKTSGADKAVIMPGGAVRVNFEGLSIEAAMYSKNEKYFDGLMETKCNPFMLTGIFYVIPNIYGEFGVSWYNTKITYLDTMATSLEISSETVHDKGYHLGAGAQFEYSNFLLTGDLRYIFLNSSSTASIKSNYFTLVVGLMYKF